MKIYNKKSFMVLESKEMILVFKYTIFNNLRGFAGYNKDYYKYEEEVNCWVIKDK